MGADDRVYPCLLKRGSAGMRSGWRCLREGVIKEPARKTPKINMDFCNTNLGLLQLVEHELKTTLGIEPHFSQPADPTRKTILASANLQKERNQKIPFARSDDKAQS
jgi:hypothetical protein